MLSLPVLIAAAAGVGAGAAGPLLALGRIRRQLRTTRRRIEQVTAEGAVGEPIAGSIGRGPCAALARSVDELVAAGLNRCQRSERAKLDQDQLWRSRYVRQRLGEEYVVRQSHSIIDESIGLTKMGLTQVGEHARAVLGSTSTIEESTRSSARTTHAAAEAAARAVDVLRALEDSFRRVDGMTEFISAVAAQTNLLSLNASIEAARAGAAGRGFGVVAQEVKALAAETARSAAGITELMGSLRRDVAEMSTAIDGVTGSLAEVGGVAEQVSAAVVGQHETLENLDLCVQDVVSQMDLLVMLAGDVDRRKHPRIAMSGMVTLCRAGTATETPTEGDLLDLSEGGVQCVVGKGTPLAVGDRVQAILGGCARQEPITAEVVWIRGEDKRDRMGLEFKDLSDDQRGAVYECIAELLPAEQG